MLPTPQIVIIGAGHAGCEAAYAAARLGCEVLLLSMDLDRVARMPCNPAIGGLAKGQLVREIDAMGGLMGLATDACGIQFRMLNASKGPAVRSPRAQTDKWAYQRWVKRFMERVPGVRLLQDRVIAIVTAGERVVGVRTALGREVSCRAAVVCTGTFPRGLLHVGSTRVAGGRMGEPAADEISSSLAELGMPMMRLKTGTCPRIDARDVDFDRMQAQHGDEPPRPFSFLTERLELKQVPCHSTWTTPRTHAIVAAVLERAPLFSGQIRGVGPRYCPSFELKLKRFPDRRRHHIFVEPEGRDTTELYLNGLATSIDPETQAAMVNSIPGLEQARITRFGYAVEYDAVSPRALRATLETRRVRGLYCAGQVNGTSGYEEAAAQGLVAGVNAALAVQGRPPLRLGREQAYIGVLVDDLVTRGTDEPYRLFTSRAEYRLLLRQDNADLRLTPLARALGLVSEERARRARELAAELDAARAALRSTRVRGKTLAEHLRNPRRGWEEILGLAPGTGLASCSPRAVEQLRIEARYHGYLQRSLARIERMRAGGEMRIPEDFDFAAVTGLRNEAREKLAAARPATLEQAGRVSGVSPADLMLLAVQVRKRGAPAAVKRMREER